MIVYIAVDDKNGMMFNNRRQSKDRELIKNLLEDCSGKRLWMREYSYTQFESENNENIIVDDDFLNKAEEGDACFVESDFLSSYADKIEKIILYKWNRTYPSDLKMDIDLRDWTLISSEDFEGTSHEKITKEEWAHV